MGTTKAAEFVWGSVRVEVGTWEGVSYKARLAQRSDMT